MLHFCGGAGALGWAQDVLYTSGRTNGGGIQELDHGASSQLPGPREHQQAGQPLPLCWEWVWLPALEASPDTVWLRSLGRDRYEKSGVRRGCEGPPGDLPLLAQALALA